MNTEPTTARPITPDDWNHGPEDFEAHLEYFESVKGRDRWTPAELGALLLPSLKLEMLLSHTAPQDLAKMHPGLGNPVRDGIARGALSSQTVEGRITVKSSEGIAWALSHGYSLPAEIIALVEVGDWTERSEDTNAPTRTARATPNDYPLTPLESEILERLRSDGPLTAPQITELLYQDGSTNSQRSVEKVLAKLKSYKVVANRRGAGYFVVKDRGNT